MRLTMRNHKSYTYRASLIRVDNNCAIGDIVDKLGKYEDICDDPERLEEMVKEKKHPGTVNRDAFSIPYCGLKTTNIL